LGEDVNLAKARERLADIVQSAQHEIGFQKDLENKPMPVKLLLWDDPRLQSRKVTRWNMPPYDSKTADSLLYGKFREPYRKILPERHHQRYQPKGPLRHQEIVSYSLKIHKVLVSMLYGRIPEVVLKGNLSKVIVFLADLAFYADYYVMLEAVRGQIERWAKSIDHLLQDIRRVSVFWVGFGRLLRSKDIFCHAMKHMVGNPYWDMWQTSHRHVPSGDQDNDHFRPRREGHTLPDDVFKVAEVTQYHLECEKANLTRELLQVINNRHGQHILHHLDPLGERDILSEVAVSQSIKRT
jgi:hypothetical protein